MFAATFLGLISALCYGATDFAAAFASRRIGVIRTMTYGQGTAALLLTLAVLAVGWPSAPGRIWGLLVITNLVNLAGTALLYRAMAIGRLTVVAPIAAAYGGVGAVLSGIAGEILPPARWTGLALLCCGAILAAKPPSGVRDPAEEGSGPTGAAPALGAALLYGCGFWMQGKLVVPALGTVVPAWSYYAMGAVTAPALAALRRQPIAQPPRQALFAAIAAGILGACGYLTLSAGQATGEVAVVTALSSLASGVTVLLAAAFMSERIGREGACGSALILGGLVLVQL